MGEGEGVSAGVTEAGTDCTAEIEGEEKSPDVGEEVGVVDSCASAKEDKMAIAKVRLTLVVMSSEVETSLTVLDEARSISNIERFDSLDMTEATHSSASSGSEKCYAAIRSRLGILHRGYLRQTDRADG